MSGSENAETALIHASAVMWDGRALLFTGPSGTGKTALCLDLIALGCDLVSDDMVELRRVGDRLMARPPDRLAGLIEARGIGILRALHSTGPARVAAEVDLSREEPDRLPPERETKRLGVVLPLLLRPPGPHPAPALLQYLKHGREH